METNNKYTTLKSTTYEFPTTAIRVYESGIIHIYHPSRDKGRISGRWAEATIKDMTPELLDFLKCKNIQI